MISDKAMSERNRLQSQVRFHRALNMGLIATLFLSLLLLVFVILRDTIKIVPPEIKRPYEIGASYTNSDYLLDMAGYVLSTVLTVTPESVDYNNKVILKMTDPTGYPELKTALDAAALRLKQEHVTTIWVPIKEEVSKHNKRVKINGKLKTFIADKLTSERDKDYVVEFIITTSGRLYVSKIEEVIKSDPAA